MTGTVRTCSRFRRNSCMFMIEFSSELASISWLRACTSVCVHTLRPIIEENADSRSHTSACATEYVASARLPRGRRMHGTCADLCCCAGLHSARRSTTTRICTAHRCCGTRREASSSSDIQRATGAISQGRPSVLCGGVGYKHMQRTAEATSLHATGTV